ncbi:M24 family metallopeptidase [Phytoactinopolyspora halotolerans]|uniref:Aminopeptidase P family protein n=1 Tax=Phytoactinopolyspora halotolerans TaxID=1981512 RepID=A0A6L9SGF2_9ACTN|nr:Xaa-Pro peptidase family protein [Phytoactinopolyspora halotolerans]NEE03170.1 aminopeptidase P family protein [Phytoactinopolyspora halotolerans]
MHDVFNNRLARARAAADAAGIDALLITPGSDLRYLTGYAALPLERLTCLVLPVDGEVVLVVPELEAPAARASAAGESQLRIEPWAETDDPVALVARMLPQARRVALDDHMWAEKVLRFRVAMPATEQVVAGSVLSGLRIVKDSAELDALRAAAEAIDRVHARVPEWLKSGRTEREVGRDIADAIIAEGHESVDFVIVAAGPNGASPHHETGERLIRAGDPVVVDIGGTTAAGYCSDETRTYVIGEPPAGFVTEYGALKQAQEAAVAQVRPGVSAESVDAAARDVLREAGLGEYFVHRTGHGIGLDTHEDPYIVAGNARPLEPGMAFSIEPGFYLPDRYGARIEDIVVVTDDGVERLNRRPRELTIIEP